MNQHVDFARIEDSIHDSSDLEPEDPIVLANDNIAFHDVDLPIRLASVNWPVREYGFPLLERREKGTSLILAFWGSKGGITYHWAAFEAGQGLAE